MSCRRLAVAPGVASCHLARRAPLRASASGFRTGGRADFRSARPRRRWFDERRQLANAFTRCSPLAYLQAIGIGRGAQVHSRHRRGMRLDAPAILCRAWHDSIGVVPGCRLRRRRSGLALAAPPLQGAIYRGTLGAPHTKSRSAFACPPPDEVEGSASARCRSTARATARRARRRSPSRPRRSPRRGSFRHGRDVIGSGPPQGRRSSRRFAVSGTFRERRRRARHDHHELRWRRQALQRPLRLHHARLRARRQANRIRPGTSVSSCVR